METTEAADFIAPGILDTIRSVTWADLGCGTGTFTKALSTLLGDGSKIHAVDMERQHITSMGSKNVEIEFHKLDFIREILPFSNMDGILMANSLHYVKDKAACIEKVKMHLLPGGQMIIVEYDTEKRSPWVPYPITFERLSSLFSDAGFSPPKKIGKRKSLFNAGEMYACSMTRK